MNLLASWVNRVAATRTDTAALILPNETLSYSQLLDRAHALAQQLECTRKTVLAFQTASMTEVALSAHAASQLGRAIFPLNPAFSPQRRDALLQVASGPVADGVELFIATSGTQGEPKAVMLGGANLQAGVVASRIRLPLQAGDVWLACLPLYHIGGMAILYRCAEAGAAVMVHEGFDPQRVWDDLEKYCVTHISLVPAMLARLLDEGRDSPPPALKVALIGGGPLSAALALRARDAGWPVCASYGMSETGSQVATLCDMLQGWVPGQVGSPLPGFEVDVVGEDGQPTSGIGRIRIRGAAVMVGYANPQRKMGLGLDQGWFTSGDLGSLDAQGNLTVLGRHDDMLVSGGTNIHPQQVEEVLKRCQGVADAALTSVVDEVWGDLLVAVVVAEVDNEALGRWCRDELTGAMRPRCFIRLSALPRNALGKLDRQALRDLARRKLE
ncbi:2-succinylbenzoate--CoA ligase [Sulfuricella denitrificans skB26]|uniref:2-succinylbenzoate--CoA ligase n=1 Tax=Sulfuricella denitrificans (strain DSM 22764 / NBRC 105220 / skB26) TaxID=1163617 RepID=S6AI60_SULDS|nr:AMP-binding protein [Sulfuricella denitrificans]BAN34209.1 2-succinylbenzoate--CoA ligase [Sulfuricella denitrificans skB26]